MATETRRERRRRRDADLDRRLAAVVDRSVEETVETLGRLAAERFGPKP
jgi:hypothetical protein